LGSEFARGKLADVESGKGLALIDRDKKMFSGSSWYYQYLHCLAALFDKPEPDAPALMASPAWQIKSCQTALAGWAQLRHTWALQAKQTAMYMGLSNQPPGFVEPEPEFFARMARLVEDTQQALDQAGALEGGPKALAADIREGLDMLQKGKAGLKNLTLEQQGKFWLLVVATNALKVTPSATKPEVADPWESVLKSATALAEMADALEQGNLSIPAAQSKMFKAYQMDLAPLWQQLGKMCLRLEALAHKQLRGQPLSDREKGFVRGYGELIAGIMLYGGNSYLTPRDDAPRVVDVVSNPRCGKYLEVGVCRPRALYVLYPYQGGEILCRGAVMPYYEFASASRLTDAEWTALLDSPKRPAMPEWVRPVVSAGGIGKPTLKKDD
jgi:hypothetical protein